MVCSKQLPSIKDATHATKHSCVEQEPEVGAHNMPHLTNARGLRSMAM